jgi:hypothetical protein
VAELVVLATEIDPQYSEMVAMFGALHRCGNAVALLCPLFDDLMVGGGQAAAFAFGLILR